MEGMERPTSASLRPARPDIVVTLMGRLSLSPLSETLIRLKVKLMVNRAPIAK